MSIAKKFEVIADAVYKKGMSNSALWNGIQNNGNRKNYMYAFSYWVNFEYIQPLYKVVPNTTTPDLFFHCEYLKKVESKYFDLSGCPVTSNANSTGWYRTFHSCFSLEVIEDIGMPAGGLYQTFLNCSKLKTITKLRVNENCIFTSPFKGCASLENITIDGTIGENFPISSSPSLSQDSINSIIDHLADLTGQTAKTVTFHQTVINNLTDEQYNKVSAKNWQLG